MGSLLIKPVQRIMKYPLLLAELWQATPEDHPDHQPLQEALASAKIINLNINEFKRRKDIGECAQPLTNVGLGIYYSLYLYHSLPFHLSNFMGKSLLVNTVVMNAMCHLYLYTYILCSDEVQKE